MKLENSLGEERRRRGWTQAEAAAAAGVSRQSYAAIEAGTSVPSTEVALRLAAALGRPVDGLFRLPGRAGERVLARWPGEGAAVGRRVRLVRIGGREVAWGLDDVDRPLRAADGVVAAVEEGDVEVALLSERPPPVELAVVGCDPAFGIVADALRHQRATEVVWSTRGSRASLLALAGGEAHVAGAHLRDPASGETNEPWIRELVPFPCTRIAFATWEEGLIVGPGNPLEVGSVADLARPGLRFLNREPGSGSRSVLDEALRAAAVPPGRIQGYATAARGHMAVGEAIASGLADAGIGILAAGAAFGLDVVPLRSERYELVVPNHFLDLPAVEALLDVLRGRGVRNQVEALRGYDVAGMGVPA
jgi:putative molybdopterin biosynthesis protein